MRIIIIVVSLVFALIILIVYYNTDIQITPANNLLWNIDLSFEDFNQFFKNPENINKYIVRRLDERLLEKDICEYLNNTDCMEQVDIEIERELNSIVSDLPIPFSDAFLNQSLISIRKN